MSVLLHGYWRSTPSWRVRIALAWKGVAFEVAPVNLLKDEQRGEAYLQVNPQGRIPTLEIDGLRLTQAPAILEYLEETRPDPPLLPRDPAERARVRAACALVACDITPLQNLITGRRLKSQFGADDAGVRDWNRAFIDAGLAELERQATAQSGRYFAGDAFSLADIHLVTQLYAARRFGSPVEDWPRLAQIEAACLALSAVHDTRPEAQPDAPNA